MVARTRAAGGAGEEEARVGEAVGETTGKRRKAVGAAAMASSASGGWPPTSPHHQRLSHRADSSPTSCAAASPWPYDAAVTLAIGQGSGRGSRRRGGTGAGNEAGLLGLRHGELGVAIGGRPKGILVARVGNQVEME
uniref:Uncharacterized protein n=1 Tax=Oryza rufipogon TaxID=4529 RepID=A0A0E0PM57_ORYRU